MKSHQLSICDMRLNVLLKKISASFSARMLEDAVWKGQVFAVLCRGGANSRGSCRCTGTAGKAPGSDACATQGQSPGIALWCPVIP